MFSRNWIDTISRFDPLRERRILTPHAARHRAIRAMLSAVLMLEGWMERSRQRRQLAALTDLQLRDIGVSRIDALREAEKPFWKE